MIDLEKTYLIDLQKIFAKFIPGARIPVDFQEQIKNKNVVIWPISN